mmetsp:Transcript_23372/g.39646  ORF Transcript_23372/g.39646 Transcript_23372/m.39646 type:complete len:92 (-) Transcript_23372:50-325(-)
MIGLKLLVLCMYASSCPALTSAINTDEATTPVDLAEMNDRALTSLEGAKIGAYSNFVNRTYDIYKAAVLDDALGWRRNGFVWSVCMLYVTI